ncbi:hypothetical protein ACTFIW_011081 [Dictyostelium discoideum]
MSTSKKIKTDYKIFQDIIDFEILKSIINYLLISKKRNNNNNNNNSNISNNQYKTSKFYFNINEIINYILVSKKWYNFISLTISNNIFNNKSFEHWLKINYNNNKKSFIENYNNQNQYDKNNLIFSNKEDKQNIISFNKEFSIIKIKESTINDYFKFNLFLNHFAINDFKEIKNKFENNQLLYNKIVVNVVSLGYDWFGGSTFYDDDSLFTLHEYVSNENPEIISNLFKILELNFDFWLGRYYRSGPEEDNDNGKEKCTEIYLNNLSIDGLDENVEEDEETVKIFKIFKGKNIIYDGSDVENDNPTHINYSALFDPHNSGQQVESIEVKNGYENEEFVEARHLMKVHQFENLHSITIPINSFQILSNLSGDMEIYNLYRNRTELGDSENMESELYQMINSFITCKSLRNLKISSVYSKYSIGNEIYAFVVDDHEILVNDINENIESYSNSFQPLFSELNTSIERIEFDCCGLLNIDTFSNLLNNKSIKYLYLNNSDFIVYSLKPIDDSDDDDYELHKETISINQYLFDNIFSSPLTSIRHYKINIKESKQLKLIFNLILNNIFKLQLYSLIFEFYENELIGEYIYEFKNLINNISTQIQEQQLEQQKSNNINLKEFKIKIKIKDDEPILELKKINNPYFATVIKKID